MRVNARKYRGGWVLGLVLLGLANVTEAGEAGTALWDIADASHPTLAFLGSRGDGALALLLRHAVVADASPTRSARRPLLRQRPAIADRSRGRIIETAGGFERYHKYRDSFATPLFRQDAWVEGLASVTWDGASGTLHLEGGPRERRRISFTYQFESPFVMKDMAAELEGTLVGTWGDRVELAFSPDGRAFHHAARIYGRPQGHAFHLSTEPSRRHHGQRVWVRFVADLAPGSTAVLADFRTTIRVKHDEGFSQACLAPDRSGRLVYRDTFECPKMLNYATIECPKDIAWRRGELLVASHSERPVRVVLRQKIATPKPLRSVAMRVSNATRGSGVVNEFGLSVDGRTLLARETVSQGGFDGLTELHVGDTSQLARTREVYVHIVLANRPGSGSHPANVLSDLEVVGLPAVP